MPFKKLSREAIKSAHSEKKIAPEPNIIIDQGIDAILVTDFQGKIIRYNSHLLTLTGYTEADLITMTIPNRISIFLVAAFLALAPFVGLTPGLLAGEFQV